MVFSFLALVRATAEMSLLSRFAMPLPLTLVFALVASSFNRLLVFAKCTTSLRATGTTDVAVGAACTSIGLFRSLGVFVVFVSQLAADTGESTF